MAEITKVFESTMDLTVFTVVGDAKFSEIWYETRRFLGKDPSRLVLWDFSRGTVAKMSNEELKKIAQQGAMIGATVEVGKVAIMAREDVDYGVARIFQVYSEIAHFPYRVRIFRDMDAARKWLLF